MDYTHKDTSNKEKDIFNRKSNCIFRCVIGIFYISFFFIMYVLLIAIFLLFHIMQFNIFYIIRFYIYHQQSKDIQELRREFMLMLHIIFL